MKRITSYLLTLLTVLTIFSTIALPKEAAASAASVSKLYRLELALPSSLSTEYNSYSFSSSTPEIVSFMDGKGAYNIAFFLNGALQINRYDKTMTFLKTIKIPARYQYFGNITCDADGNYYVCWGDEDPNEEDRVVTALAKYSYSGAFLGECALKGSETFSNCGETQVSFDFGSCAIAINNGIVACNMARLMYNGHQSNFVFYVNSKTMTREYLSVPYTSHSFYQECTPTSDGGFLIVSQGDAHPRGYEVSKVHSSLYYDCSVTTFHFREGTNRSYGYNETYAQLGGIAETGNAYVLCASSERTLSLDVAPTKWSYCSYSEPRDLFVQILKKDFYNYSGQGMFRVTGQTRVATGTPPQNAETELRLDPNVKDYGVLWLTDYDDPYFVASPKILSIGQNRLLILWEKRNNLTDRLEGTYYMILNEDGSIHKKATGLGKIPLPADSDVIFDQGSAYWVAAADGKAHINILDLEGFQRQYPMTAKPTLRLSGNTWYYYEDARLVKKTGLVSYNNAMWYVKNGKVDFSKTGLVYHTDKKTYYVKKGKVDSSKTGLVYHTDKNTYYIKNGKLDWSKTGLVYHTDKNTYYVKKGKLDWSKTGLVYHTDKKTYYVKKGKLDWSKTGLVYHTDKNTYYVKNGKLDWSKTGLVYHTDKNTYYVKKGKIDWSKTGIIYHTDRKSYFINKGKIDWSKTGLVKHTDGKLYYVKKGKVDWTFSGRALYNGKYYTVKKGVKI